MNVNSNPGNIPFGDDLEFGKMASLNISMPASLIMNNSEIYNDYQVKMDPWEMDILDQDFGEARKRKQVKDQSEFDFIMVASLIDKIPNLAGLSRTCEIMRASELVIPSLGLLEEQNFKNIAMTSDKWLPISEVKPSNLPEYIAMKRLEGYQIIALEQSSRSCSLQNYEFPLKTCLILGNEREGVPAEILHLVDDCVEIPQFGMVRSLNVHVSGSIVLWEARKQQQLRK